MGRYRRVLVCALAAMCAAPAGAGIGSPAQPAGSFVIRIAAGVTQDALEGRLLLLISKDASREPRLQVSGTSLSSAQVFGIDVDGLKSGDERVFDAGVLGYPLESLSELPPGEYFVQGLLHKYETFHLATGHTVKLPMDRGEGQQ